MSRQNRLPSVLLRAVWERRLTRFRNRLTRDVTLTAKYNEDLGDGDGDDDDVASGRVTDDLSSGMPNENE